MSTRGILKWRSRDHSADVKLLTVVILFLVILRPHFLVGNLYITTYLADVFLGIAVFLFGKKKAPLLGMIACILLACIALLKVILNGCLYSDTFLDIIKVFIYVMTYQFVRETSVTFSGDEINQLIFDIVRYSILVNLVVVFFQLLPVPALSGAVNLVYNKLKLRNLLSGYPRVYGTFFNCNWFGVYVSLCSSVLLSYFLKKRIRGATFTVYMVLLTGMIFVSGSRTALVGYVICIAGNLMISIVKNKNFQALKTLGIAILLFVLLLVVVDRIPALQRTFKRFSDVVVKYFEGSQTIDIIDEGRVDSWESTLGEISKNALFGATGDVALAPHNSFLRFLAEYGVFGGVLVGLPFFVWLIRCVYFALNTSKLWANDGLAVYIVAYMIMCFTGDYLFSTQSFLSVLVFMALTDRASGNKGKRGFIGDFHGKMHA